MAFKACEDCGSKLYSGVCPNCEELEFIMIVQAEVDGTKRSMGDRMRADPKGTLDEFCPYMPTAAETYATMIEGIERWLKMQRYVEGREQARQFEQDLRQHAKVHPGCVYGSCPDTRAVGSS